jgi:hypothetical protein
MRGSREEERASGCAHEPVVTSVHTTPAELASAARAVQILPYRWPAPPDGRSTELAGAGSCAGKHALLAERLTALGIATCPLIVVGPLAPPLWPDLAAEAGDLLEVHECLTVLSPWAGSIMVDVTWHPAAVRAGLPGLSEGWEGTCDTPLAIPPSRPPFVVNRTLLRTTKEALRLDLYRAADRQRRDAILAEIAARAACL